MPLESSARVRWILLGLVFLLLLAQLAGVAWLSRHISYEHLSGGPDEPMHLSMANSIAEELAWPSWDSPKLERYRNGVSYATGPSFGYWIEGLLLRFTGETRRSGVLLFASITGAALALAWRRPLAGLICAASVTPQVMFVFSYVNADAWAIFVAFNLGLSIALVAADPASRRHLVYFFGSAAACLTAKQHLWAVGFVAVCWALVANHRTLRRPELRTSIGVASLCALIVASWWPLTSYWAHDGDWLAWTVRQRSMELFGTGVATSLAVSWQQLDLLQYALLVGKSAYGYWGWAWIPLPNAYYTAAAILGSLWLAVCCAAWPRCMALFVGLPVINFLLMLIYSLQYDYQWQGRYMLPSLMLIAGAAAGGLVWHRTFWAPWASHVAAAAMLGLSVTNLVSASALWDELVVADRTPAWRRGEILFRTGDYGWARFHFERALAKGEEELRVRIRLASIASEELKHDEAVEHYREALRLRPGQSALVLHLAGALEAAGRGEEAVAELEALLESSPQAGAAAKMLERLQERRASAE